MAECDERSWLAALSLMNSGIEADSGSIKPSLRLTCPRNVRVQWAGRTGAVLDAGFKLTTTQAWESLTDISLVGRATLARRFLAHLTEVAASRLQVAILYGAEEVAAVYGLAALRQVSQAAILDAR